MQDRYTGDIGDFGKYGLLRALCSGSGGGRRRLKLGVNWYLVPDAGNPNDGSLINYLRADSPQAYLKNSDPQLYTLLQSLVFPQENGPTPIGGDKTIISQENDAALNTGDKTVFPQANDFTRTGNVKTAFPQVNDYLLISGTKAVITQENGSGMINRAKAEAGRCPRKDCPAANDPGKCISRRCVAKVEKRGILPGGTLFYNALLDYPPNATVAVRKNIRNSWVEAGFALLEGCDIVFFDPDNGLPVLAHSRCSQKGNKYVFDDEIAGYYKRGQSIIIYQHRSMEREEVYLQRIRNSVANITGRRDLKAFRLRYRRGTARDFIVLPNHRRPRHSALIEERMGAMLPAWRGYSHDSAHFEKYYI